MGVLIFLCCLSCKKQQDSALNQKVEEKNSNIDFIYDKLISLEKLMKTEIGKRSNKEENDTK